MSYAQVVRGKETGKFIGQARIRKQKFQRVFDTKLEADGYEGYVKATGEEPPHVREGGMGGPTFSEVLADCRRDHPKWRRGRDKSGQCRLDFLDGKYGHKPVAAIDKPMLLKLVNELRARPGHGGQRMANGTINRYLSSVSAVLRYAHEAGQLPVMPVIPWAAEEGKRIRWLQEDDERRMVTFMQHQGWNAEAHTVRILCATGLRYGEYLSLNTHMLQGEWIKLDKTKTDTPRDVPISAELMLPLRAMVANGALPEHHTMRRRLARAAKSVGLEPGLTIHCLRHTTATRLVKRKVQLPVVQKFLGHKSINTTLRYTHIEADDLLEAAKNLSPTVGPEHVSAEILPLKRA